MHRSTSHPTIVVLAALSVWSSVPALLHGADIFTQAVQPLLREHCFGCHGDGEHAGDVRLDGWTDAESLHADQKVWERVRRVLVRHEMPPADEPQLSAAHRESIVDWIDAEVLHIDCDSPDPGRVTIRRLNRSEYRRTIRDLIGVEFNTDDQFPVDPSGHGFDNIGDVLSMPPVLMEKYLFAAEQIAAAAIVTPAECVPQIKRFPPDLLEVGYNARQQGNGWVFLNSVEEDDLVAIHSLPVGGEYKFRAHAYAQQDSDRELELTFLMGAQEADKERTTELRPNWQRSSPSDGPGCGFCR